MRIALFSIGVATLVASAACGNEYHPEYHPQMAYSVNQTYAQNVNYPTTVFQVGVGGAGSTPVIASSPSGPGPVLYRPPAPAAPPPSGIDPSRVIVFESAELQRPGDVVGVVDVTSTGDHDAALGALRRRAAEMGADAVVGVEFHDAEREGQPNRVSGLAVRLR